MPRTSLPLLATALLATVLATTPRPAWSAWPHDPTVNVPVCAAANSQYYPAAISDGAGGTIVTWYDGRDGVSTDIYAQRISATGATLWATNGVALCTASGSQAWPAITSDGAGGAIVTWQDQRTGAYDIYAQRITAAGVVQWTANGVALSAATGDQQGPVIASDGAGGAVVAWYDTRNGGYDIYAQRISAAGAVQWTANGVALCTATNNQWNPAIASDGAGGAIVAWQDLRGGSTYDVYAQRVSSAGAALWVANGTALCAAVNNQWNTSIVADGAGGAIVAWSDYRGGSNYDIYAQRISSAAVAQWTADGVALCAATADQTNPKVISDDAAGAIVVWNDSRGGAGNSDIYVQRISMGGAVQWAANGVAVCTASGNQTGGPIVPDGAGGAIVAWYDARSGSNDIYAQKVSGGGTAQWTANGVALCARAGEQIICTIASDGAGGAIVAWDDYRNGNDDVYAQRVDEWGYLGAEPTIASVRDIPNDQGGLVKVSWSASPLDVDPLLRNVDSYLVFRSAPPNLVAQALRGGAALTRDPSEAAGQTGRLLSTGLGVLTYYWEYVGTQEAYHLPTYSMVAPTTGDSISGSNPRTAFLVQAWVVGGDKWWSSAPDSGYSVDNLAPLAPAPFTGQYAAGTATLHWAPSAAADLGEYRLYRDSNADFVPGPANLVTAQSDTGYVDAAGAPYYYKLCAVDVHGNASSFSTLLPSGTVDVPGPALPRAVFLAPPAPNPARGAATLRFGLPREAHVELAIFDQQGRRVRALLGGTQPAGERTIAWNGCDENGRALPAGLYFVRLASEGRAFVSRLAVIR